ncbi:lipase 3 [Amyelois transitella]|uniref:lipase 3 n=1 Tax=Amyelois transitella TaxID=680683 RepID=UPI00067C4693|nr:lipase 3 [Amyelois transitella]
MLRFLLISALAVLASARRSPNADYVEKILEAEFAGRYSNNIIEDALLDVPGLVTKYRYPLEVHTLTTSDGYILEVHRIPHGRDENNTPDSNKPVVLLMHGLWSSSADYVLLGPGNGLAYILAEAGFDVWMGNARGNYYSKRHLTLNSNGGRGNIDYWKFSWDEIGNLDLPVIIDHIIATTGQPKLHYIGHSQGSTTFLVLNSLRPEYNDKFISFHAMAPAAFFIHSQFGLWSVAPLEAFLEETLHAIGVAEILGNRDFFTWFAVNYCFEGTTIGNICDSILNGNNPEYYNSTLTPLFFGHTPAGCSLRQMSHYGQSINTKKFRRYNDIPIRNIEAYGRPTPPEYDLNKVTVPTYFHYSYGDVQADYRDVEYLADRLPNVVGRLLVERDSFNHFDFIWGVDAKDQLYDRLAELMLGYHKDE